MYKLLIKPYADCIFLKLAKKNPKQLEIINKKIEQIKSNPFHTYKYLRSPLQNFNRVHIDKHFVLIFRIIHSEESVEIWYYGHHGDVYKGKFVLQ
jgi:mRNA-degrading endonuclease RelE of RelBE toxin-antitoxin system